MARQEKHRNTIYTELRVALGEGATQALLSRFPARDVDEPVSREHLDRRLADLTNDLTTTMLTISGLGLAAVTALLAAFT